MSKEDIDREKEIATVEGHRTRFIFGFNVDNLLGMFSKAIIGMIIAFILYKIILEGIFHITIDKLFDVNFLDELFKEFQDFLSVEWILFFTGTFLLTAFIIFVFLPNSPVLRVAVCDYKKRMFDPIMDIPITHTEGNKKFSGNKEIIMHGETPFFMTYAYSGEKSVMAKDIMVQENFIHVFLTNAYTVNDFEALARDDLLERFPEEFGEALKEVIAWRSFFAPEVESQAAKNWKVVSEKIDPRLNFRALEMRGIDQEPILNIDHSRVVTQDEQNERAEK